MDNYLMYVGVATLTILLPGPAVILTIRNSIQLGLCKSFAGILGVALAILLVAFVSATSLGMVIASSAFAFNAIKFAGAIYLIYMGIKLLRKKVTYNGPVKSQESSFQKCFIEGFLVSSSNPKSVIFFMSIFPQFVDLSADYTPQLILLAVTFSALVLVIHTAYAVFSSFAKSRLTLRNSGAIVNKISGGIFVSLGLGLALMSK